MPDKKVLVRFYPDIDADLINWLEDLAVGEGNDTIKAMLRAGIEASSGNVHSTQSAAVASMETLDPISIEAALESFLPRIREVMDAALASAHFVRADNETAEDENSASPDILKGHMIGDDEDD
jgi:hypothetical protein